MEDLFDMGGGYVLDFVNRTFQEFVEWATKRDIDHPRYEAEGTSKANRLRCFWIVEDDRTVGRLVLALADHAVGHCGADPEKARKVREIGERLRKGTTPSDLAAIEPLCDDATFVALADEVRARIEEGQPERGLDRLHTFTVRFFRHLHEEKGHRPNRDKPLHSLAGEYAKMLERGGKLQSPMTERIIRANIGLLQAYCAVRNNESLAHDNVLLNRAESVLILNQVCSLIRFLRELEGI